MLVTEGDVMGLFQIYAYYASHGSLEVMPLWIGLLLTVLLIFPSVVVLIPNMIRRKS